MNKRLVSKNDNVILIASRRETNKFLNQNFHDYIRSQLKIKHQTDVKVLIKGPTEEKCLQATDIVSWSIFRKYEHHDSTYYEILNPIIVEENVLYK